MNSVRQVVTLPRLRIPSDSDVFATQQQQQRWTPSSSTSSSSSSAAFQPPHYPPMPMQAQQQQQVAATALKSVTPVGPLSRSPSSPAAFFQDADNKFGLTHLLEAAEQCLPVPVASQSQSQSQMLRKRSFSEQPAALFPQCQQQSQQARIPSLAGFLTPVEESDRSYKRPRPELPSPGFPPQTQYQAPYQRQQNHQLPSQQQQPQQQFSYLANYSGSQQQSVLAPAARAPVKSASSPIGVGSPAGGVPSVAIPSMIWETVLASGEFPAGVGLSESASQSVVGDGVELGGDLLNDSCVSNAVKQGRWSCDEKQYAQALIDSVRAGEAVLPPNISLRRFLAESLQCKAMRVSKKFRSLRASQSPMSPTDSDDADQCEKRFNPLSLSSIMNNEGGGVDVEQALTPRSIAESFGILGVPQQLRSLSAETPTGSSSTTATSKKAQRVLKRSDYSQHGTVRSGRWSLEEENYAKAMIEAFKNGYLPLHGNVSLRKFLSEVLVCHPMRISKKFVGYVRKYHWYRIAAGKNDPEAKQAALQQLAQLERTFWASTQANEWSAASPAPGA